MAKAFEKQTKTIEYQGEKQIKAIEDKELNKSIKEVDDQILLRQKEIYNEILDNYIRIII